MFRALIVILAAVSTGFVALVVSCGGSGKPDLDDDDDGCEPINEEDCDLFVAKYDGDGELEWARRGGGPSLFDGALSVATLGDGSAVLTGLLGYDSSTWASFDGATPEEVTLNEGGRRLFIARYASDGTIVWVRTDGGGEEGASDAETIAAAGDSIVLAGRFYGTSTFGTGDDNEVELDSNGSEDIFLASYTSDGSLAWVKRPDGNHENEDGPSGLIPDKLDLDAREDGSSLLTGYFMGTITFGLGEPEETVLDSVDQGENDMFVAAYEPDGALSWASQAQSPSSSGGDVAALPDGGAIAVGAYFESAVLNQDQPSEVELTAESESLETLFAHYQPDGSILWAESLTPQVAGICWAIDDVPEGGFVAAGSKGDQTERPSLARFDGDGQLLWVAETSGTDGASTARDVCVLDGGDILATGAFTGTVVFGEGEAQETELTATDADSFLQNTDIFVARYTSEGELVWAISAGGSYLDTAYGIAALDDGSFYIVGSFEESATFGPGDPNETTLEAVPAGTPSP